MSRKQMLIVDDNQGLREALKTVFEDEYELTFAASGEEALKRTFQQVPEVVLMDYRMPGLNGVETMSYLKQLAPDSQMVIMSAWDDQESVKRYLGGGAVNFVGKPFDVRNIKQVVGQAAEKSEKIVEFKTRRQQQQAEPVISQREVDLMISDTLRVACL